MDYITLGVCILIAFILYFVYRGISNIIKTNLNIEHMIKTNLSYMDNISTNLKIINANLIELSNKNNQSKISLSLDEVDLLIDTRINELWQNKYLLYYTIRKLKIIPNMDNELEAFVVDVFESFGSNVKKSIYDYYTEDYLVKMITRRAQILMVDYINTHKPITK